MDCDVLIPVGPGHEQAHLEAIESVRIASMKKGMFDKINIKIIDDTQGKMGRSAARNRGIKASTADWLFFLDADDLMHPNAFQTVSRYPCIDALWGNIWESSGGVGVWRYQVPELKSYRELVSFRPYLTLQMGHFVKRVVAEEVLFDESMNCGEDFKYYLQLWKKFICLKIEECLLLNRKGILSTGERSATGKEWNEVTDRLINEARLELNPFVDKFGYVFPSTDTHFTEATFELDHIKDCVEACKEHRVALDIGAHVGAWSRELGKYFTDVYAYEAKDINFECLKKNAPDAICENVAVGDRIGFVSIHQAVDPGNTGAGYVTDGNDVEQIRLDDLCFDMIDFIKIDVEGYEPYVLEGAKETIERTRPVILIEQTPGTDGRYGMDYFAAGRLLELWGYKLWKVMNKNYLYVPN